MFVFVVAAVTKINYKIKMNMIIIMEKIGVLHHIFFSMSDGVLICQ